MKNPSSNAVENDLSDTHASNLHNLITDIQHIAT